MLTPDSPPVRCFVDGIDWEHHLERDASGTLLFPSERACRQVRTCIAEGGCGIVEVEVRFIRWVEPQNLKYFNLDGSPAPAQEGEGS